MAAAVRAWSARVGAVVSPMGERKNKQTHRNQMNLGRSWVKLLDEVG